MSDEDFLYWLKKKMLAIARREDFARILRPEFVTARGRLLAMVEAGRYELVNLSSPLIHFQYMAIAGGHVGDPTDPSVRAIEVELFDLAIHESPPYLSPDTFSDFMYDAGRLGNALKTPLIGRPDRELLAYAIDLHERGIRHATDDVLGASFRSGLGMLLQIKYEFVDMQLPDLKRSAEEYRQAVEILPRGRVDQIAAMMQFGDVLRRLGFETGDSQLVEEAIMVLRTALVMPPDRLPLADNINMILARSLVALFDLTGDLAALQEAISLAEELLTRSDLDPATRAEAEPIALGCMSTLRQHYGAPSETIVRQMFQATANSNDQVGILAAGHRLFDDPSALAAFLRNRLDNLPAGDMHEPLLVFQLAGVLATLAGERNERSSFDEALLLLTRRRVGFADGDVMLGEFDAMLGQMSLLGADRFADPRLLDDAIEHYLEAGRHTSGFLSTRSEVLIGLGDALASRFRLAADEADRERAIDVLSTVAAQPETAPLARIAAAHKAARLAESTDPGQAAQLLAAATDLLPMVAPRQLGSTEQQRLLGGLTGLAAEAAAAALETAGDSVGANDTAVRALGLLEVGRMVLFAQQANARDGLTDLRRKREDLADRFESVRGGLDRAQQGDAFAGNATGLPDVWDQGRVRYAHQMDEILAQIRALPGFDRFALPPRLDELIGEAQHGPIVVLTTTDRRGDALILTTDGIDSIPLPGLTTGAVTEQADRLAATMAHKTGEPNIVLEWLWTVIAEPVLTRLAGHLPTADTRIWWVPCGPLSRLPLHAAGFHRDGSGRTLLDRVVSSYSPSVRALRYARERQHASASQPLRALIIGADRDDLPAVRHEVHEISRRINQSTVLDRSRATTANVLDKLPRAQIVHFAGHAVQDPSTPSENHLRLSRTDRLTVAMLQTLVLTDTALAYLSACRTVAHEHAPLVDENIHLAGAFQLAGFPQVIGTMWEVPDRVALRVAESFYSALGEGLDGAVALRAATREQRAKRDGSFSHWAAYLHTGA